MTRHIFVTRADGSPAYLNAPPRKRQSHIDAMRKVGARYQELSAAARASEDDLPESVAFLGKSEPSFWSGILCTAAGFAVIALFFTVLP